MEPTNNISEKAFAQIKEEGIQPSSEMKFHFQRSLFWLSAVLSLVVGALAVAITLYVVTDNDWDILWGLGVGMAGIGWTRKIIYSLPYFWLTIFSIFLIVAHYTFRHTKFGYRYRLWQVVLANVLLAIMVGSFFYFCGLGANLDYALAKTLPAYKEINNPRIKIWSQPREAGLLAGEIVQPGMDMIILEDLQNNQWRINIQQAKIKPSVILDNGERIKVIGRIESGSDFIANEIRPWFGRQIIFKIEKQRVLKETGGPARNK